MATGDRDRWNHRWSTRTAGPGAPDADDTHESMLVDLVAPWLPATGRLLDVAGGMGTDAVAFARRGLDVTVVDVSDVGLAATRRRAAAAGLSVATVRCDLETTPPPSGPWAVITVANYLQRDLVPHLVDRLVPGGILGVVVATTANLERHPSPSRRFLLEPGELRDLVADLEVVHHSERWRANGRHEAHLVARSSRPAHVPITPG